MARFAYPVTRAVANTECSADGVMLSRRRRAYIQCYVTDYSPGFLKCPRYGLLGLLGARSRPATDIEIASKSNWSSCYVDSTAGIRGRTPRPTSLGRL